MELPVVVASHGLKWDCRSAFDEVPGLDPDPRHVGVVPSASVLFLVLVPLLLLCEQQVASPSGDACCDLSVLPLLPPWGVGLLPAGSLGLGPGSVVGLTELGLVGLL